MMLVQSCSQVLQQEPLLLLSEEEEGAGEECVAGRLLLLMLLWCGCFLKQLRDWMRSVDFSNANSDANSAVISTVI